MKDTCIRCAASSRSHCPAINGPICGPCCGTERNRSIKCTADCKYNPFGIDNYDTWLEIDKGLVEKKSAFLKKHYSDYEMSEFALKMMPEGEERTFHMVSIAATATVYYFLFGKKMKNGKTVAQIWKDGGWLGLKGDEITMMNYRMSSSPALIEVQKIADTQSLVCIDILTPQRGSFLLFDRTLTKTITRFSHLWIWIADYPFYSRPAGDPVSVPQDVYVEISKKTLSYKIKALEKNSDKSNVVEELGKRFGEIHSLIYEETRKEKSRSLRSMDCHICKGFYAFKTNGGDVKQLLDTRPEFQYNCDNHDDAPWPALVYYWLCLGESSEFRKDFRSGLNYFNGQENIPIIGTVFLGEKELMIQALSKRNFEYLKKKIQAGWGNYLEFKRESIVDLAQQVADRVDMDEPVIPKYQKRVKESDILSPETIELIKNDQFRKHYENFLEIPVPALNGMTPIQAAKSNAMRPALIELMKYHIHNIESMNRKNKLSIDVSWILEKLGLSELM